MQRAVVLFGNEIWALLRDFLFCMHISVLRCGSSGWCACNRAKFENVIWCALRPQSLFLRPRGQWLVYYLCFWRSALKREISKKHGPFSERFMNQTKSTWILQKLDSVETKLESRNLFRFKVMVQYASLSRQSWPNFKRLCNKPSKFHNARSRVEVSN